MLRLITRKFTIRLSDYIGFYFVPSEDENKFRELIVDAYKVWEQKRYASDLRKCMDSINRVIEQYIDIKLEKYWNFNMQIPLNDFTYIKDIDVYMIRIDCLNYLYPESTHIVLNFDGICNRIDKELLKKYYDEIAEQWRDGFNTIIEGMDIYPNYKSSICEIIISGMFVNRCIKNGFIPVEVKYEKNEGLFKGIIPYNKKVCEHKTHWIRTKFPTSAKESIKGILFEIHDEFIITFYSSYMGMFNEPIRKIRQRSKAQTKKIEAYDKTMDIGLDLFSSRYNSGGNTLLSVDKKNDGEWMWLIDQLRKGYFKEAYVFYDKNITLSSIYKSERISSYYISNKVYLCVKENGINFSPEISEPFVENYTICMYTFDLSKSTYYFDVKIDKLNEALFFIWSYFSSKIYNKRADIKKVLKHMHLFGITRFCKSNTLSFRDDLGFCDALWLYNYEKRLQTFLDVLA